MILSTPETPNNKWQTLNMYQREKLDTSIYSHCAKSLKSYATLRDPVDCSPPGSSVHGILQTRILEWIAIPFSRDLPNSGIEPESPALQVDSLPSESPEEASGTGKVYYSWKVHDPEFL